MNIFYDENMPYVHELFSHLGSLTPFNGRTVTADDVQTADVLLVRSVTKVNESLLHLNSNLKFVGTATIGVDHIDQTFLSNKNIPFFSAPGCNAIGVADYIISALLVVCNRNNKDIFSQKVGIVGVGNIGKCLQHKLSALGIDYVLCDPIRARAETASHFVDYETLLKQVDVVTFHVPLTHEGEDPTFHMFDKAELDLMKPDAIIMNASRGEVLNNSMLLERKKAGSNHSLVLDVWENEPNILTELIPFCDISSAHIAGYSLEGKARGTDMLYQSLCETLKIDIKNNIKEFLPSDFFNSMQVCGELTQADLTRLIHCVYDVRRDDDIFRYQISKNGFDWIRKNYPVRREFSAISVKSDPHNKCLYELGFSS